jgi:isoquinoline 1-oxidoreductase beta subunit
MQAAAETWKVPVEELTAKVGTLYHEKTMKVREVWRICIKASAFPVPKGVKLKDVKTFNVVRNSKKNVEGQKIVPANLFLDWIINRKEC